MKKLVCAAIAMLLPGAASAQISGVYGAECVRFWTDVLKGPAPPPGDPIAVQRNLYSRFGSGADPLNFISQTCRMDRALVTIVINDETATSGLPQGWNLPAPLR